MTRSQGEAERLESLWAGSFGRAYVERNIRAGEGRDVFWNALLKRLKPERCLEIGCNVGGNLRWIAPALGFDAVFAVDVNREALKTLHEVLPGVNAVRAAGRDLPFRDRWFDLVFTAGVLIHQPEESLEAVMREAVRCSRKYVLCLEYFAEQTTEVPYRGETGALFKRNYGQIYLDRFQELKLADKGYLSKAEGWDDITWWLLERKS